MTRKTTVLDLFAGAGGLSAGFRAASNTFETVRAVEWDNSAAASYEATFGSGIIYAGDIKNWLAEDDVPEVDVIIGGPPCQGFSTLGKQDVEDERNDLWKEYAATIRRSKPKYFVIENVSEFRKSPQYEHFKEATSKGGALADYGFKSEVLNAADYGAAQARKRAVLIGYHRDFEFPGFPERTHSATPESDGLLPHLTVADILTDVPNVPDMDSKFGSRSYSFNGREFPGSFGTRELHWSRNYRDISLRRFAVIPPGGNRRDLEAYPELMTPCWTKHKSGSGDVMGRLHWERPAVTIRTEFFKPEKGRYLHPWKTGP
ncbi:DNA (cytosine-5-)-methyltransferase [Arthrobacter sp. JCM 19049]|uniref:DNA cytosine methyltransferase n=1 Tax=Arthrobacter sp. JCM 19049 TaxID=1460643 RepID=UPI0024368C3A|nr:DNA (cytosine-5-)-methyltransferase [Arthrobacter sp. JCM 19049]